MRFEFEIKRLGKLKIETILAAGVTEKDARRAANRCLARNERLGSVIWANIYLTNQSQGSMMGGVQ
jgi:hypothetical protein